MQKFWMALGAAAALASPLISVHAASQKGFISAAKVAPHGTSNLGYSVVSTAPKPLVPFAKTIVPPVDDLRYTFGPAGMDLSPDPTAAELAGAPEARSAALVSASDSIFGFDGMSHYDQRFAGTGVYYNTQFSEEPPDMALAVGNGYAVQAINNAIAVYNTDGTLAAAPTPMYQFLGLAPQYVRGTRTYGNVSLSDTRAYFDPTSKRFFIEEWGTGQNPDGSATGTSAIYVAVSVSSDPTGGYTLYTFDTTFDPTLPGVPDPTTGVVAPIHILPDYVQIGADANGFYMSINQFDLLGSQGYVGPRILAVSKAALIAGTTTPVVSFSGGDLYNSNAGFTVQPAKTPAGGSYAAGSGGTEYFLSSIYGGDKQLGIWAITNTASLGVKAPNLPSLTLSDTLITSLPYTQPTAAIQKAGPYPVGQKLGEPENKLASGDTRMTSVTYVQGHLYSALETSFAGAPNGTNSGFTYFSIAPSLDTTGSVTGIVDRQGYVRIAGETVSYPTLAINSTGGAVVTCSLIGPDFYPSAAFVPLDSHLRARTLSISSLGTAPSDGFSGYVTYGGKGTARWGDYSEAQSDENGSIWMAQEMISASSAKRRSALANYGTHITKVNPTSSFSYK